MLCRYFKPKGISSWCRKCTEAYAAVAECGKYLADKNGSQLPSPDVSSTDASVNQSSTGRDGEDFSTDPDNGELQLPEVKGGPDQSKRSFK